MDDFNTGVEIVTISSCYGWIGGCFGRITKLRNNKVGCAFEENNANPEKELREHAEEMQNKLSKLEKSRTDLWLKWKEAESAISLNPAQRKKVESMFEGFMIVKRHAQNINLQLEELKDLTGVTSLSTDDGTASVGTNVELQALAVKLQLEELKNLTGVTPLSTDDGTAAAGTVKEKKTVRFDDNVNVKYYKRKEDMKTVRFDDNVNVKYYKRKEDMKTVRFDDNVNVKYYKRKEDMKTVRFDDNVNVKYYKRKEDMKTVRFDDNVKVNYYKKPEKKSVRFSNKVDVAYTSHYDRTVDKKWKRRSLLQMLRIRSKLAAYKKHEMKVHPDSR